MDHLPKLSEKMRGKVRLQFSWTPSVGRIPEAHQTQGRRKWKSFQAPFTHGNRLVSTLIRTGSRAKGELARQMCCSIIHSWAKLG